MDNHSGQFVSVGGGAQQRGQDLGAVGVDELLDTSTVLIRAWELRLHAEATHCGGTRVVVEGLQEVDWTGIGHGDGGTSGA